MLRRPLLLLLLLPLNAFAQCTAPGPEPFAAFIEAFGRDKAFAITRTEYPLLMLGHGQAAYEEGAGITRTRVPQADDAAAPTLAELARADGLHMSTSSLTASAATVRMEKPDTDYVLEYVFVRKGRCWYLRQVQNHSL